MPTTFFYEVSNNGKFGYKKIDVFHFLILLYFDMIYCGRYILFLGVIMEQSVYFMWSECIYLHSFSVI